MQRTLSLGEFYGQTLAKREVNGFMLTDTSYEPGLRIPKHSHEHAYFCLVRNGTFSEELENITRICRSSIINFHPAGEAHSDNFHETGGRCLNVQIGSQWLERARDYGAMFDTPGQFQGGLFSGLAARLFKELHETDKMSCLVIEGLILEILGEASRQLPPVERRCPAWIEKVREIIHADHSESLSLSKIADLVGLHQVHVAREFRRHNNCTIGEYIRQVRVDSACQRLTTSNSPIAEIAHAAGFVDQSHFCKTFRRLTGQTPSEFRFTHRTN
jgi:AraC family transcriptional regulator